MRFLVDVNLPRRLVGVIRGGGHDGDYVTDHLPSVADDSTIWSLAATLNAAILTKDDDFVDLASRRSERVAVVWLRCGNIYNPALVALIARHLPVIVAALEAGERIIELR